MVFLGIDLWDKRVGTALSRENIAFADNVIQRVHIMKYIKLKVWEEEITDIIVWLPYDLYGTDTRQLDKTQKFIQKLKEIFPLVNIVGHDERFSSFEASEGFDGHRDDIAAQCILQSYLDSLAK